MMDTSLSHCTCHICHIISDSVSPGVVSRRFTSFLVFVCSCRISKPRNSDSRWASQSRTSSKMMKRRDMVTEYEEL